MNSLKLAYFIVNFKRVVKSQDEDVVKPVVVEKNHPVEVHLQQKIDDQPSETSAENEGLFANARESGQNDVDSKKLLTTQDNQFIKICLSL